MGGDRRCAVELRQDLRRQLLAELDTPLIEAVDVSHTALHEHDVLVQGDQLTQHVRRQSRREDGGARSVPGEHPMRLLVRWNPLGVTSSSVFERQCFT